MNILLTGAGGFLGSYLLERLAQEHKVYATARSAPTQKIQAEWIIQDLAHPLDRSTLPEQIDTIIHLAQSNRYREFPEQAADVFDVNVGSTVALLDYARQAGASRFIYASTGGVYGHKDAPLMETDPVKAQGFYAASKYAAELMIEAYAPYFSTLIARLFFVYGARQKPTMLIPRLVRSIYHRQPVLLQGADGIRVNPTYVGDAVEAFSQALKVEGQQVVNMAGPQTLSLREIAQVIGAKVGREPIFEVQNVTPNHLVGDITHMKTLLCEPKTGFTTGADEVCDEFLQEQNPRDEV